MLKLLFIITDFVVWVILITFVLTVGFLIWNYKRKIAVRKIVDKYLRENRLRIISQEVFKQYFETESKTKTVVTASSNWDWDNSSQLFSPLEVEQVVNELIESVGIDRPE